jgi:alpha/beta superfamily hydrolase
MHAEVLIRIARTLVGQGFAVLRFNFRGVGRSEGHFDEGRGEVDDLVGALDLLSSMDSARGEGIVGAIDARRLAIVGYSFGAWVGGQVASRDERVRAFVAVALPVSEPYGVDLSRFTRPKCFITGENDALCPPESLRPLVGGLPEPKTLRIIPDTDHFLLGCEQAVADHVAVFLASSPE